MISNQKPGVRSALVVAIAAAALSGCGSDGASSGGSGSVNSVDATSTSGTVITVNGGIGGKGIESSGGSAGGFELYKEAGSGDVKVLSAGTASAGFTALSFTPSFGANGVVVAANTAVTKYADCTAAGDSVSGTLYVVNDSGNLYKSNGGAGCDSVEIVTGLKVNSGVTLTLPLNSNSSTQSYMDLNGDVQNLGTITTTDASATQRGNIQLYGSSYTGSGKILTKGTAAGQNAGDVYLYFDYAFVNSGEINASGANSSSGDGGQAGYIDVYGDYYVQNTGALNAKGGDSTFVDGIGGSADYVELYSYYGAVNNSGAVDGRGGKGATGGNGGGFYAYAQYLGGVNNKGKLSLFGADSSDGDGGRAGEVEIGAAAGVRNSGALLAYGGKTTDAAGSGGYGGDLEVNTYAYDYGTEENTPAGSVAWSGRLALHGGDAVATGTGSGGSSGGISVEVEDDGYDATAKSEISFLGYTRVDTFGGAGTFGGNGNRYELYNYDSNLEGEYTTSVTGGNVVSQVAVKANGGNARADGAGTNGYGGYGGSIDLETDYNESAQLTPTSAKVTHSGAVDLSGGQNRNGTNSYYGRSGYVYVWGINGVTWSGAVTANGGNDVGTGASSYGGYANSHDWESEYGTTKVTGNITANGGNGDYVGGNSYGVYIYGSKLAYAGTIKVNGGNANAQLGGSSGGSGGGIWLQAVNPNASTVSGSAQYNGGTGVSPGNQGSFFKLITCAGNCNNS
ncbi:MAG: hypothetical protein ACRERR_05260 [Moraxellaceae bacterium]